MRNSGELYLGANVLSYGTSAQYLTNLKQSESADR